VYVYSSVDYELKKILNSHDSCILSVAWSPYDSNIIAVSHSDSMFYVWNANEQKYFFDEKLGKSFISLSFSSSNESAVIGNIFLFFINYI
jgi:WD40 repeat protein